MKPSNSNRTVWGVFVGNNGDQLEIFNSKSGPFPPAEETDGYIAIGWPATGDLRMFKNNYADFVHKFRVVYWDKSDSERVFKTRANMPWYFAFAMRKGDYVICPCSSHGLLLVGEITGDYDADYHDELNLYGKKRCDFVHVRCVRWKHIIPKNDPRHSKLNRIGQLTVSQSQMTFDELQALTATPAAA
jgi:predicted Mrr-cat superfamily restriction endonuclease